MANVKISDLTAVTPPVGASDLLEIETSGGASRKATAQQVVNAGLASPADIGTGTPGAVTGTNVTAAGGAATITLQRRDTTVTAWTMFSAAGNFQVYNANTGLQPIVIDVATDKVTFINTTIFPATALAGASCRLPHGTAPTSPVDGDMWTTTAGLFVRINGVTKTVTLT